MRKKTIFILIIIFDLFIFSGCVFEIDYDFLRTSIAAISTQVDITQPVLTLTPLPSSTPIISTTPIASATHEYTPTVVPFVIQPGTPAYIENFAYPDEGCEWMGIAGQVFNQNGQPLMNVVITVEGSLNGTQINATALTGIAEANIYGPGGYEVVLANDPFNFQSQLELQLFDLNGDTLSQAIPIETYKDCSKNLIILNFVHR